MYYENFFNMRESTQEETCYICYCGDNLKKCDQLMDPLHYVT